MTPQELKNSILQLAIQGKLVPQRAEEGTAEELYNQIQAEKQNLIKAGKIKKEKPLPTITDGEKPFEIPNSWKWVRFGEVVHYNMGKTPPRAEEQWWGNDIPWISISDMKENGYVRTTKEKITQKAFNEKFNNQISLKGTLIMSFKLTVGRVSILDIDAVHNEAIISIYPYMATEDIMKNYFFKILPFVANWGDSNNAIKGKTLNSKSINNLVLPLPPLAEQKRIVAKIEKLLPYVERYEKAYNELQQLNKRFPGDLQKSVLQLAIQGRLVSQCPEEGNAEELYNQIQAEKQNLIKAGKIKKEKPLPAITDGEKPFEIPNSWKWVRFNEIMNEISTGPFGSMLHKSDYVDSGIPLINPANIKNGKITVSNKMMVSNNTAERLSKYILKTGMIIMGRRGEMGRCAVITNRENGWLCGTGAFFMIPSSNIDINYIKMFFETSYAKSFLSGESIGTTMSNLNHSILKKLPIPLPPLAEQKRIVAKLEEILPLCDKLK